MKRLFSKLVHHLKVLSGRKMARRTRRFAQASGVMGYSTIVSRKKSVKGTVFLQRRGDYFHEITMGKKYAAQERVYDAGGNLVQRIIYDAKGNPKKTYFYSPAGKWIGKKSK